MKVRLLTALGILVFGLPILIFSEYIVYPIALGVLSALASWEVLRVLGLDRKYFVSVPSYILAALLPFFSYGYFFAPERQTTYILILALSLIAYMFYLISVSVFTGGTLGYKTVASAFMMVSYVIVAFSAFGLVRYMENGVFYFEMLFIGAWVPDIFAYLIGSRFGKHRLAPVLSPKKSVEGAIAGVVFGTLAFLLYGFIIEFFFSMDANYLVLGIMGFVLTIVAQIGDLWASLIKREYGVKDYSNILPGHGGILDRFDSVLSISAVLMVICLIFPPFTAI